jgi:hypothetical protein
MKIFTRPPHCFTFKKYVLKKLHILKIYYHITFQDPILSGTSFTPTSQVCAFDYRKLKNEVGVFPIANVHKKFCENQPTGSKLKSCTCGQHDDFISLLLLLKKGK